MKGAGRGHAAGAFPTAAYPRPRGCIKWSEMGRGREQAVVEKIMLEGGGTLSLREDGPRVHTEARRQNDGQGLYKVWLRGGGKGRLLLGTLVPEGGELVLSRTLSRRTLEDAGWLAGGGREGCDGLSFYRGERRRVVLGGGALEAGCPTRCWCTRSRSWGPLLVQRGREEVRLAASFRGGGQFPLVPLFCFGTVGQIRGREYVIFLFDRQGTPKMPYNFGKGGKPKAVDQSR